MSKIIFSGGTGQQILPQGEDVQTAVRLNSLNDVTITSIANGQILKFNSTSGKFENVAADTTITEIDGGTY